jgi:hypothetical protein
VDELVIALGPGVSVSPDQLAGAWNADETARSVGVAGTTASTRGVFGVDVVTLVVIPLLAELASGVAVDLVLKAVRRARPARSEQTDLEVVEVSSSEGDRFVAVRLRQTIRRDDGESTRHGSAR